MAGGPINGSALGAKDKKNPNAILIPTVVQMATDIMDYWLNMTCLYDPYHTADNKRITLPICMFHVTNITEVRTVEVSKQRVILYEPQNEIDSTDQLRTGVMQTIVDNSVKQPTTYTMEVIVPFQPTGRYFTAGARFIEDVIQGIREFFGDTDNNGLAYWEGKISAAIAIAKTANQAANAVSKYFSDGSSYINMNSLQAMADSCRTLCMKMWTGMEYKFVEITGLSHVKKSTEDDVFRATLNLQEMPVLEVFKSTSKSVTKSKLAKVMDAAGSAITWLRDQSIEPLLGITGVRREAIKAGAIVKE